MNILLVNPPYNIKQYMGGLGKIGWVFPPIGLLYIASYIRTRNASLSVQIYDSQVEDREFAKLLHTFKPEVVGITCQSSLVYSTIETAKIVKEILPGSVVVVGGVHATLRPQDLLDSKDIDVIVRGEGEETFLELCNLLLQKKPIKDILGVSYLDDQANLVNTQDRAINDNLDDYPMPALDLIPLDRYHISPDMRTGSRFGMVLTSRGCPYNCIFCANKLLTKRTYRLRSIENVISEIEYYILHYDIDQLMIIDDNFSVNKKRTLALCQEFIDRGYNKKITWWAEARVDCVDEEILIMMKKAGCRILSFGLESGNQRLLDFIGKKITLAQVEETVKIVKKVGIKSRGSFILGLPTETRAESLNTIKFAYKLPLNQVRFAIATPFPGTALWDIAIKEGKIDPETITWTHLSLMGGYTDFDPLYFPDGRTAGELKQLQRRANLLFYLKPRVILDYLGRVKSFEDLSKLIMGGLHFVKSSFRL